MMLYKSLPKLTGGGRSMKKLLVVLTVVVLAVLSLAGTPSFSGTAEVTYTLTKDATLTGSYGLQSSRVQLTWSAPEYYVRLRLLNPGSTTASQFSINQMYFIYKPTNDLTMYFGQRSVSDYTFAQWYDITGRWVAYETFKLFSLKYNLAPLTVQFGTNFGYPFDYSVLVNASFAPVTVSGNIDGKLDGSALSLGARVSADVKPVTVGGAVYYNVKTGKVTNLIAGASASVDKVSGAVNFDLVDVLDNKPAGVDSYVAYKVNDLATVGVDADFLLDFSKYNFAPYVELNLVKGVYSKLSVNINQSGFDSVVFYNNFGF